MAYNRIKNLMINKKDKIIEKFIQFNKNYRPPRNFLPQVFNKRIIITNKNNRFYSISKLFFDNYNLTHKLEKETSTRILCNDVPLKNISSALMDHILNGNEICLIVSGDNQEKVNHAINVLRQLTREDIRSKGLLKSISNTKKMDSNTNKISNSYLYTTNKNSDLFIKKFKNIIKVTNSGKNIITLKNDKIELNKFMNINSDKLKKSYLNFLESIYNFHYKVNLFSNIRYKPLIKSKHTLLIWEIGDTICKNSIIYKFIPFGLIEFSKSTKYYHSLRYFIIVFRNPCNLKEAKNIMDLKFFFSKRLKVKII
mmetsp:Transcript_3299/g.6424  ORF Transcript_3299/g.6424 Transcript_3299/m.6424 type:complete len:311 (-) Transcript_3299:928-1860(-)